MSYLESGGVVGHGAADPLVAAVLLDVQDPLLTLRHDLRPLQVKVFVDHLRSHDRGVSHMSEQPPSSIIRTTSFIFRRGQSEIHLGFQSC